MTDRRYQGRFLEEGTHELSLEVQSGGGKVGRMTGDWKGILEEEE